MGKYESHEVYIIGKGKDLYLGMNTPMHQYRLETNWLESSLTGKKKMGVLVDKLNIIQCRTLMVKKTDNLLGCVRRSKHWQQLGSDPSSLLSHGETYLECYVQFWAPQYTEAWTYWSEFSNGTQR